MIKSDYPQMVEIVPSILSADFARLAEEIARVERGGATMLHLDVMDGHFVHNLTIGPPVVESIRKATKSHLDVHLMIENPGRYAADFVHAGANSVLVHYEACPASGRHAGADQERRRDGGRGLEPGHAGVGAGRFLEVADYVLLMSVNPGFGGQQLIPYVLDKVRKLDRDADGQRSYGCRSRSMAACTWIIWPRWFARGVIGWSQGRRSFTAAIPKPPCAKCEKLRPAPTRWFVERRVNSLRSMK